MKAALADAVQRIKDAGFSHIKVELEADIGRDGEQDCDVCSGEGREECSNCYGSGAVTTSDDNGNDYDNECAECYGDGNLECSNCEGAGNVGGYHDEDWCYQFMHDNVPSGVGEHLNYSQFYDDGSVDSEFTFTLPMENVEDVIHWMNAFKALAEEIGGRLDVAGAGMHITVLPNGSDGVYPCHGGMRIDRVRNFTEQMNKLMPALFFLASAGHQSRDLGYRHPQVHEEKYSAVCTHQGTCYEFRVFETCYDRPEAFFDFVETIANCLKFHANPQLSVDILGKEFGFSHGNEVARFFNTAEQLRILNATVKHIKPRGKTLKQLKRERGVHYTVKSLTLKEKQKIAELKQEYRQYKKNFDQVMKRPLSERDKQRVEWLVAEDNIPVEEAEAQVKFGGRFLQAREFINRNLSGNFSETVMV